MQRPKIAGIFVSIILLGCLVPTWAAQLTLDELMSLLRQTGFKTVKFEETRHIASLDIPLISRGEMEYRAPDYLRRTTIVQNRKEVVEIEGDWVRLHRGGDQQEWSLDAVPGVGVFALSLRAVLVGDGELLRRRFDWELDGSVAAWSLTLRPIGAEVRKWVERLQFDGAMGTIRRIEIRESNGDQVLTVVQE